MRSEFLEVLWVVLQRGGGAQGNWGCSGGCSRGARPVDAPQEDYAFFCHLYFVKEYPHFGRKISATIG